MWSGCTVDKGGMKKSQKTKQSKFLTLQAEKELFQLTALIMPTLAPLVCNPKTSKKQLDDAINRAANCYWKLMGRIKEDYDLISLDEQDS